MIQKRVIVKKVNRIALKKSIWSSLSRVVSIVLSAGAGGMIHKMIGTGIEAWGVASLMVVLGFIAMLFAEYEREK
jgi:hypothetical protein